MTYVASRGGHAPDYLRAAMVLAIEQGSNQKCAWFQCLELRFDDSGKAAWWSRSSTVERVRWLIGQLWNCSDTVPGEICEVVEIPRGSSYANLVRKLKSELHEEMGA